MVDGQYVLSIRCRGPPHWTQQRSIVRPPPSARDTILRAHLLPTIKCMQGILQALGVGFSSKTAASRLEPAARFMFRRALDNLMCIRRHYRYIAHSGGRAPDKDTTRSSSRLSLQSRLRDAFDGVSVEVCLGPGHHQSHERHWSAGVPGLFGVSGLGGYVSGGEVSVGSAPGGPASVGDASVGSALDGELSVGVASGGETSVGA